MERNILKKILFMVCVTIGMLFGMTITCNAASITVTTSKASVAPGETFTATVRVNNGAGRVTATTSNGSGSHTEFLDNSSFSFQCTAGSSGTVTVSASGVIGDYATEIDENRSGSATVMIIQNTNGGGITTPGGGTTTNPGNNNQGGTTTTKDTNANLRSLGFSPKEYDTFIFNVNTLEYRVSVPSEVTSINVYANTSSSNASVSGAGTRNLQEGTNRINVTVTAQAGNTKTYTIWVTRAAGSDGEVPPNVIDEPVDEETPTVNGLSSFEIPEIELDKEFKIDVYEYIVKTKDEITKEWLEEIKEKLVYATTNEAYTVDKIAEVIEEGKKATITIIVKDGETEIAKYVVTFEREEEKEPVVALVTDSNSNNTSLLDLTFEQKMYILITIYGITFAVAVFFAINCYLKSKRLEEYDDEQEVEEDSEFEKMNKFYVGANSNIDDEDNKKDDTLRIFEKEETGEDIVSEAISKSRKLGGYRNLRNSNRSSGRHF